MDVCNCGAPLDFSPDGVHCVVCYEALAAQWHEEGIAMASDESLPDFTSEKPCPCCKELLHWSEHEHPPTVSFHHRTGRIWSVSLMRFCMGCGYREIGTLNVNQNPVWQAVSVE